MIAKVCAENDILVGQDKSDFLEICADVLFNRTNLPVSESTSIFQELLNNIQVQSLEQSDDIFTLNNELLITDTQLGNFQEEILQTTITVENSVPFEREVFHYSIQQKSEALTNIQNHLKLNRDVTINALTALEKKCLISKQNRAYSIVESN